MGKYANYEIKTFLILSNPKGELLMSRNDHADSIIYGYINPIGGHLEIGENLIETTQRETEEELGIKNLKDIQVKGIINVQGFKDVPVLMFVISATVPETERPVAHDEGTPIWVSPSELNNFQILEDVEKIIDLTGKTPNGAIFHAVSKFENRKLISFEVAK